MPGRRFTGLGRRADGVEGRLVQPIPFQRITIALARRREARNGLAQSVQNAVPVRHMRKLDIELLHDAFVNIAKEVLGGGIEPIGG